MVAKGDEPREYPERPVVGVGGVVIPDERALLIRRGKPPLEGEWSIPGECWKSAKRFSKECGESSPKKPESRCAWSI